MNKICLHNKKDMKRSPGSVNMGFRGEGDCYNCTHDEENKNCAYYYPINVVVFEVEKE